MIILNYNNCRDTRNCIRSVLNYNSYPIKIIVVDNASRPEEKYHPSDEELSYNTEIVTLELDKNEGYARGNNAGLEIAYQDDEVKYVMILNNDILFTQDIISTLIQHLNNLKDCAIISPVLYKKDGKSYDLNCARLDENATQMIKKNFLHYWYKWKGAEVIDKSRYLLLNDNPNIFSVELPSGSCMLMKKDFFKSIGFFDPTTFLYYEENILFSKIKSVGRQNYICQDVSCIHLGASTTSTLPNQHKLAQICQRSAIYYLKRYKHSNSLLLLLYLFSSKFFLISLHLQKFIFRKLGK